MDSARELMKLLEERSMQDPNSALPIIDGMIDRFSKYMSELDSPARGALSHPERALLKTFVIAVVRERI